MFRKMRRAGRGISRIISRSDYLRALLEIEVLMSAERGASAGRRLDALVKLFENWEARQYRLNNCLLPQF